MIRTLTFAICILLITASNAFSAPDTSRRRVANASDLGLFIGSMAGIMQECGQPEGTWKEDLSELAYAAFPEKDAALIMKFYDSGLKGDNLTVKRCTARNLSDQKAMMEGHFAKFRESYPAMK